MFILFNQDFMQVLVNLLTENLNSKCGTKILFVFYNIVDKYITNKKIH